MPDADEAEAAGGATSRPIEASDQRAPRSSRRGQRS